MCPEEQSPSFTVKGAPEIRHEGAVCSFTISFTLTGRLWRIPLTYKLPELWRLLKSNCSDLILIRARHTVLLGVAVSCHNTHLWASNLLLLGKAIVVSVLWILILSNDDSFSMSYSCSLRGLAGGLISPLYCRYLYGAIMCNHRAVFCDAPSWIIMWPGCTTANNLWHRSVMFSNYLPETHRLYRL